MEIMTIQEAAYIFVAVAFIGIAGAFIHSVHVTTSIERYWFERHKEKHRKEQEQEREKREKGFE